MRSNLSSASGRWAWYVLSAFFTFLAGCNSVATDFTERIESSTPDRLRGLSIGYDISKLWMPDPPAPTIARPLPRSSPHARSQVPMTLWWQTADGTLRHQTLPAHQIYGDPDRIAGAVWFRVTPAGAAPPQPPPRPATRTAAGMP